jgi:hypothetical protein
MAVTLNMTIVAPWGVWQCYDHRLTKIKGTRVLCRREDLSVKHVTLQCPDGGALITYTGLGAANLPGERDVPIADWLRRLVRGWTRTVDQTLILLREAATRDLAGPAKRAQQEHAFLVGAFLQRRPWWAIIANVGGPPGFPVVNRFETAAGPADTKPQKLVGGAGRDAIDGDDWALLDRITHHRPSKPDDYCQVLADIHRRARHSKHPARRTISEACTTVYMPPRVLGGRSTVHWSQSDPTASKTLPPKPTVHLGLDGTDIVKLLEEQLRLAEAGTPMDPAEFQRRAEGAARRAVEAPDL